MYANSYSIAIDRRIILTGVWNYTHWCMYRNEEISQQSKLKKVRYHRLFVLILR